MSARASGPAPRGSETILLVASEPETRKLAAFMLVKQGYTVLEARNGAEAIGLFEQHEPEIDLLLADTSRFRKNGANELARKLAAGKPALRVLYMTDPEDQAEVRRMLSEREPSFLPKPFTMDVLAGRVREVLDAPRVTANQHE